MYFDSRPKNKKEDLYGRQKELTDFTNATKYASILVITGLRRTGKTSFLNVALNQSGRPHTVIDLRGLPYNPSYADIIRRIEGAFKQIDKAWLTQISEALNHVKGVTVLGAEFNLEWGKNGVDLPQLFGEINTWAAKSNTQFLLGFDEIQLVRGDKWIPQLFAHIADSYRNITLVLTGSECGLMFDFLGFDDPKSPLYGRHNFQIHMHNFSPAESSEFLTEGFAQIGLAPTREVIEYAVENLDGVVGWLTLFGTRCRDKQAVSGELVDEVVLEAGRLARDESLKLVSFSSRYGIALNSLARLTSASWTDVRAAIEAKEKHSLTTSAVSGVLNTLVKSGFVVKVDGKYVIADPLMAKGIRESSLPE